METQQKILSIKMPVGESYFEDVLVTPLPMPNWYRVVVPPFFAPFVDVDDEILLEGNVVTDIKHPEQRRSRWLVTLNNSDASEEISKILLSVGPAQVIKSPLVSGILTLSFEPTVLKSKIRKAAKRLHKLGVGMRNVD